MSSRRRRSPSVMGILSARALWVAALAAALVACAAPRPLAAGEGWVCAPCSRIARRVELTPAAEALGADRDRRRTCRDRR